MEQDVFPVGDAQARSRVQPSNCLVFSTHLWLEDTLTFHGARGQGHFALNTKWERWAFRLWWSQFATDVLRAY